MLKTKVEEISQKIVQKDIVMKRQKEIRKFKSAQGPVYLIAIKNTLKKFSMANYLKKEGS